MQPKDGAKLVGLCPVFTGGADAVEQRMSDELDYIVIKSRLYSLADADMSPPPNAGALMAKNPKLRVLVDDGMKFVRETQERFDLMAELAEPAPGCKTRFLVFYSDVDQLIVPQRRGRISHPDLTANNVRVRGVGHLSLPFHSEVVHQISGALWDLDEQDTVA